MRRLTAAFLVLILVTLVADILVRLTKPAPQIINETFTGVPLISSWIDIVLAVEFGIPAATEFYSHFL
jgi:hypothetical protein